MISDFGTTKAYTPLQLLKRPSVILGTFLGFKTIQTIMAYHQPGPVRYQPQILLVELLVFAFFSILAIRSKKFALWVMGVNLAIYFTGIIMGLLIPFHQYFLKIIFIVLGVYFGWGGIVLIQQARRLKGGKAEPLAADGHAAAL